MLFALSLTALACLESHRGCFVNLELSNVMVVELPATKNEEVVVAVVKVKDEMFPEEALLLSIIYTTAPITVSSYLSGCLQMGVDC